MNVNTEVLCPLWAMMNVVERDWESWSLFNLRPTKIRDRYDDVTLEEDEDETEPFPEYDSTHKFLEILERHNIHFDPQTGEWK